MLISGKAMSSIRSNCCSWRYIAISKAASSFRYAVEYCIFYPLRAIVYGTL